MKEPVYVAMVRTTNDDSAETEKKTYEAQEQCTVPVGEDKTKTRYPEQVQPILNNFSDIFLRDLPAGLPPRGMSIIVLSWCQVLNHPTGLPTKCRQRDWMN